mmetsp:Transcript_41507/g.50307  ORF Transcript_41507/g.50307 Transcript_41507/m.50307 type:complete len:325 (+) Transcript_41507:334-1308(+)|eukprot:CAMPEP_0197863536 /NCGR_PEP_ID=MMETSP1438-20131217/41051_1 /TAXON_ID=1461541 /ORGANISM="Pterosperma sp., Strain CCMP1384" /LENGTH=324 /DNA_ID=CAMNT_0043481465 /DNA_START=324 /DNA_END=1298 /DNA_ORIENTATION=+
MSTPDEPPRLSSPSIKKGQSRRQSLLEFAGVCDVKAGVLGGAGEVAELTGGGGGPGDSSSGPDDKDKASTSKSESIPGRRTGSIWMKKKKQKFPYNWQKRLFVILPTELRLRYFKEDDDALVACGCVDLRSLKWSMEDPENDGDVEVMKFEARQIDKRRIHVFELAPLHDKGDANSLMELIRDRLDNSCRQPSLGISYALDNELKQKLAIDDKGVLVVQTWEDGPSHRADLISYVASRKAADRDDNSQDTSIGDIIQSVNGTVVTNPKEMFREIRKYQVHDKIQVTVKRGDTFKDIMVTLGTAQAYPDSYNIPIGCRIKINKVN